MRMYTPVNKQRQSHGCPVLEVKIGSMLACSRKSQKFSFLAAIKPSYYCYPFNFCLNFKPKSVYQPNTSRASFSCTKVIVAIKDLVFVLFVWLGFEIFFFFLLCVENIGFCYFKKESLPNASALVL